MVRVGMVCPNPGDITSIYRGWGPFSKLKDVVLVEHPAWGWKELIGVDVLFVQRPFQPNFLNLITEAKKIGVLVWVDYDDNLLAVPFYNAFEKHYRDCRGIVERSVKLADVTTVSTEELKSAYSDIGDCRVVENIMDPDIYGPQNKNKNREKVIVYRGGDSHRGDLYAHKEEIIEAYRSYPEYRWEFWGCDVWFLLMELYKISPVRVSVKEWGPYIDFVRDFVNRNHEITYFPLIDESLNRCKSLNAFYDSMWAGSKLVCPSWYSSGQNRFSGIREAIEGQFKEYVHDTRLDLEIAYKRVSILKELC